MKRVANILLVVLGVIWASPVTLLNFLLHVGPLWLLQAYEYVGRRDEALVWALRPADNLWWGVRWVTRLWEGWGANSVGNIIVFRRHPATWKSNNTLAHELEHTNQVMRLGVLQPILYVLNYLTGLAIRGAHPYYDNMFEVAARRRAGQIVDVLGVTQHIRKKKES